MSALAIDVVYPETETGHPVVRPQPLACHMLLAVDTTHPLFWFLAWLDSTEKLTAIKRVVGRAASNRHSDELTFSALCSAQGHFAQETYEAIKHCQAAGLLLSCWEGTRALEGVTA